MDDYNAAIAFVDDFVDDLLAPVPINADLSPVDWIEKNFYLYDTEQLITFHERQRRPLVEALRMDGDQFAYNTILWSWPKKSAKSSVIAAVALYVLCNTPRASVALIANDQKQSDSRVGYYLREAIKIAKRKGHRIGEFKITPSGYKIENLSNGAIAEMLPIDPNGEAGANSDLIVYSELHGWASKAHQRMWSEMTLSPNKFGKSRRIIDTYAGHTGESPILEMLFEKVVKPEYRLWGDEWEVYANSLAKLFATWVTKPWLPWQAGESGKAYYEEQAQTLTPAEFDRMHRNQWVSSTSSFIQIEWWDACRVAELPTLNRFREVVVALDAAVSGDCFAIGALSRHGDLTALRYARKWAPVGGKIQYRNPENPDDRDYPEGELRWLCKEYNVVLVTYDPYQLHSFVSDLSIEGIAAFEEFNQEKPRLVADKALYDCIRDRRIVHDGSYPDMREHLLNANSTADDKDKLRIVKRASAMKIDLAVALSMANERCRWYLPA